MFEVISARIKQKYRTISYPKGKPLLPDQLRGLPELYQEKCQDGCAKCMEICPVQALTKTPDKIAAFDLGKCLFCLDCSRICPEKAIKFTQNHCLSTGTREALHYSPGHGEYQLLSPIKNKITKLFGRSLKLRQVSAGGCNACEADLNVLGTVGFDLGRFGIQFVASPRHADGIVVTGPVSKNMKLALQKTFEAVSSPKIVICLGACAISGGPFHGHEEVLGGAADILPIDLFIPGCPPHPLTILDGMLRLLNRLDE